MKLSLNVSKPKAHIVIVYALGILLAFVGCASLVFSLFFMLIGGLKSCGPTATTVIGLAPIVGFALAIVGFFILDIADKRSKERKATRLINA